MPKVTITEDDLAYALDRLPEGWFTGQVTFRQIAIDRYTVQGPAESLRLQLLRRGWLEAVKVGARYRYRKVRKER